MTYWFFSSTFEEHLKRLEAIFDRLTQHNLELKTNKCEFFKKSATYLGHVVSQDGIATDLEKIAAVAKWPRPTNVKELRQWIGFVGYNRRYIKDFSKIIAPLNALLKGHCTLKFNNKNKIKTKSKVKPAKWHWDKDQEQVFNTIKEYLVKPPVLAYADYQQPFILHTDASGYGLGLFCIKSKMA